MKVAVITSEQLNDEFRSTPIANYANVCVVKEPQNVPPDTYIVFDLLFEPTEERISALKKFLPRPVLLTQ